MLLMYTKCYFIIYTIFKKNTFYIIFNTYFFSKFQYNINDICKYKYMIFVKKKKKKKKKQ